jgi:hypothetical protein
MNESMRDVMHDAKGPPHANGGSTRRDFLAHGVLAACAVPVLGAMGPFVHVSGRQDHDLVVRGGAVFDGLGAAAREVDVALPRMRCLRVLRERSTFLGTT